MNLKFRVEPQIGHWVAKIPIETLQQLVDSSNLRPGVEVFDIENNRAVITRVTWGNGFVHIEVKKPKKP